MCLIVDVNMLSEMLLMNNDEDLTSIRTKILSGIVKINYGGSKLLEEYSKNYTAYKIVLQLDRAGFAILHDQNSIDEEEDRLKNEKLCISDDEHIIALAVIAKVRILCSKDIDLHSDFTNTKLLSRPKGKVYQNKSHDHLLINC